MGGDGTLQQIARFGEYLESCSLKGFVVLPQPLSTLAQNSDQQLLQFCIFCFLLARRQSVTENIFLLQRTAGAAVLVCSSAYDLSGYRYPGRRTR